VRASQDKMPKQPDCKWAQRPDKIMLTLNVANVDPAKSDIKVRRPAARCRWRSTNRGEAGRGKEAPN